MLVSVGFARWFDLAGAFLSEAVQSCRHSWKQVVRKATALLVAEAFIASSAMALAGGPPLPRQGNSADPAVLASFLLQSLGFNLPGPKLDLAFPPMRSSLNPASASGNLPDIFPNLRGTVPAATATSSLPLRPMLFQTAPPPPGISGLQPNSGAPGATITITGANFGTTQGTGSVTFNGLAAAVTSWSNTSIAVIVPAGVTSGNLIVTAASGLSTSISFFPVINPAGPWIDQVSSADGPDFVGTSSFSTTVGNEVLLAFASAAATSGTTTGAVSGGGLTWTLVQRTNTQLGTSEIWRAFSPAVLTNAFFSVQFQNSAGSAIDGSLTVAAFAGADTSGTNGSGAIGAIGTANSKSGVRSISITTTRANSAVFSVGDDPGEAAAVAPGTGQSIVHQIVNQFSVCDFTSCPATGTDTLWVQQLDALCQASGTVVTLSDASQTKHKFNLSAVEVRGPAVPSTNATITSLSGIAGPVGSAVTISGANFGATQGASTVTFNGVAAVPTSWDSTSIVVPVPEGATTGNVVVTVSGHASNGIRFIVLNSAGLAVDQVAPAGPVFSTSSGNELLLAFISIGPSSSGTTFASVSGGGLTWQLIQSTETQQGAAQIWRAFSPYLLSNASVAVSLSSGTIGPVDQVPPNSLTTVISFIGVDASASDGSAAIGAVTSANSASGAPTASLITTRANSMVFGVGDDPDAGIARTVGPNQTIVFEQTDGACTGICQAGSADDLWVQQLNGSVTNSGTTVTIDDIAPAGDSYNLTIVEVRPPAAGGPTITSLSPTAGPVGTSVTITGSNFGATQGTSTVTFAGVLATPTSWTGSSIVVPVPASVPVGAASVVVTVTGGGASAPATFTVVAPLAITASVAPAPNAAGWNNTNVTVSFQCTGGVTPVQCPAAQSFTTESANQTVTATATDANGNQATVTTTVRIDKTSPLLSITAPANNSTVTSSTLQVSGSVSDALSGVAGVSCNGTAGSVQAGAYSCLVTLAPGPNTVTVLATDVAGNSATQSITVTLGPAITDFNPKTGPSGTAVSILGSNLTIPPNASTVTFAGPTGPLSARINFASSSQLAVVVPAGAITGPITVTTSAGTATTASPFTVGPTQDFQVTVSPGTGTLQQGSSTAFVIGVSSAQTTFTQLASLSVTGLPQGVTAAFSASQITAGASSTLSIDLGATDLAVGTYPFTVHAVSTIDGKPQEKTANGTLNVIAAGQTTLSGQVLTTANEPIVNASISLDGQTSLTDGAGRFFLAGVLSGANRTLSVDGHSASSPNATFPLVFEPVNVVAGRANVVPTPFHLPPIDTSQEVTINPTVDTVAGNASVANLQMTIPAGANLRMLDGTLVTRTSITPLPPDRTPAPLPSDVGTNLVYTSQPGGAITDIPIPVVYPNQAGLNPGTEVELYAFDHANVKWYVYGFGRVSTDGRTIAPEIDPTTGKPYGLKDFSWHFPNTGPNGNPSDPNGCPQTRGPHPVDYATGMKIEKVPQISWGGARGGLSFSLVYTTDKVTNCPSCPFGHGWTHNWDIRISGSFAPGGAGRLIMPDQVTGNLFSSSGTDSTGITRFISTGQTSVLGGSILEKAGSGTQYRDSDGTTFNFNSAGQLVSKVDRNGNATTLTYNNGLLTQITDPVGRSLTFTYDGSNRITTMTDPLNRVWHYTYEGTPGVAGTPGLTTITDPAGNVTRYTYVNPGRIASITDPRGNTVKQITYDANGRVASQSFADGGTETYNYQLAGTIVASTTITSATGRKETHRFNAGGYTLSVTDNQGQTSTITRDLNTNLAIASTGPCGCGTGTRTFDSSGNVTSAADATNATISFKREPVHNNPVEIHDPLGHKTDLVYDNNGNLLSVTNELSQVTNFGYDQFGELTTITGNLQPSRTIEYDQFGSVSAVVDALQHRSIFEHDILGRTVTSTDPLGHQTSFTYDPAGHVKTYTDAAKSTTTYGYDANGNLTTVANALGDSFTINYDAKNRPVSAVDPLKRVTTLQYSTDNELLSIALPSGRKVGFSADAGGLISAISDPASGSIQFAHDNQGRMTSLTDERQNTINITYDVLGRPISRSDGLGNASTASYDAVGHVTQVVDREGRSTNVSYDVLNRVSTISYPDAVASYTYDEVNRVTRIDDTESGSIEFTYDADGQVTSETTSAGTVQYSYDASGRLTSVTPGNRPAISYSYDLAGRLASIIQGTDTFSFGYDALSRRTSLQRPNGITTSYLYDKVGRLAELKHSTGAGQVLEDLVYGFDDDDRITSVSSLAFAPLLPVSTTIGTADADNRIALFGPLSLDFDDLGETLTRTNASGSTQFQWDARGRVTQATLPSGQVITYSYDPLGRLASRTSNGLTVQYLHVGSDVVADLGSDGSVVDYLNGPGVDEKLRQANGAGPLYFLEDHLGSTIALTDPAGSVAEREQYEPFGFSSGSLLTRFGFTGRERDADTGLLFYRARWYDPQQGRFLSEDPAGLAGGSTNAYSYTNGDPINARDPSGQIINLVTAAIGLGVGALVGATATTAVSLYRTGHLPTLAEVGKGAVAGAVTGGLIGLAGPLAAPLAGALGGGVIGAIGSGAIIGGVAGAIGGASGQGVANLIDPCHPGSIGKAAVVGGLTGAISGGAVSGIAAGFSAGAATATEDGVNAATTTDEAADTAVRGDADAVDRGAIPTDKKGIFTATENEAGGQVYTNDGVIKQGDFGNAVSKGLYEGQNVEILSGGHGTPDGEFIPDPAILQEDVSKFGDIPGVTIHDISSMSQSEIQGIVNGPGVIIGGFCYSGACLLPLVH